MIGLRLGHDRCWKKVTQPKRSLLLNPSLSTKVCYLNSFSVGLLNGKKTTKNDFNWKVNISKRTAFKASKFSMTLSLDLSKSSSKFIIITPFGWVGLLNGRKTTKNDFNWKVNISKSTAVKASKFSVTLSLDLSNSSSKFGISTLFYSEMLKVRKRTKNDLNWNVNISKSTAVRASKVCVALWLEPSHMFPKFEVWISNGVEMPKVRKTIKFDLHNL